MAQPRKPSAKARAGAARLAAVQALYQHALIGTPVETVVGEFVKHRFGSDLDGVEMVTPEPVLFGRIVRGAAVRRAQLLEMLAGALDPKWPPERLELLLRVLLQAGAWELLENADLPARVIVSDYVNVANAFFGGREPAMVNGVLDRLAHLLRPQEWEGDPPAGPPPAPPPHAG